MRLQTVQCRAFLLSMAWLAAAATAAPPPVVTNLNDSGPGSLRQVLQDAGVGATVTFDAGLAGTIALTSGQLDIARNVTIAGPGANIITISGGNASRILNLVGSVSCSVSGLTLANGSADTGGAVQVPGVGSFTAQACHFVGNRATTLAGGAIYYEPFAPKTETITDCVFIGNTSADRGGAIYAPNKVNLQLVGCTFAQNNSARGGALACFDSAPMLERTRFESNAAAGMFGAGGAVAAELCTGFDAIDCEFVSNTAQAGGGGVIIVQAKGPASLKSCTFRNNTESGSPFGGGGSGLHLIFSSATVVNCAFSGNRSLATGSAALYVNSGQLSLVNSTIAGNSSPQTACAGLYAREATSQLTIVNTIIWGNTAAPWQAGQERQLSLQFGATALVSHCRIQSWDGSLGGTGNSGVDPLLFDPAAGNLRLKDGSSAIDAGDNSGVPGGVTTDLAGRDRFVDHVITPDTGNGTAPIVDIGAYERFNEPDCNGNGTIDDADISGGTSTDLNTNGVPDECEDCNTNTMPDDLDIANQTSADCNNNTVPDECDIAGGTSADCNGNSIPDSCEIADLSAADCNTNSIPDSCELSDGTAFDCNANSVLDSCEIAANAVNDCNANGVPDECDIAARQAAFEDFSGNDTAEWTPGIADSQISNPGGYLRIEGSVQPGAVATDGTAGGAFTKSYSGRKIRRLSFDLRIDSSSVAQVQVRLRQSSWVNGWNYTISGPFAGGVWETRTLDFDPNWTDGQALAAGWQQEQQPTPTWAGTLGGDMTSLTIQAPNPTGTAVFSIDNVTLSALNSYDCNGNSIPDECDIAIQASVDCDGNGTPDECEPDCNRNRVADACDIRDQTSSDCNANALPDECEMDCDANQVPDDCDIASGTALDCNRNGVPDSCDIAGKGSDDCNGNSVPDECDTRREMLGIAAFGQSELFSINRTDGTLTRIATISPALNNATGLARHPGTGTLYAVLDFGQGRVLAAIDPTTGATTTIGTLSEAIVDLAFHDDGTLYGILGNGKPAALQRGDIVTISTADGSLTAIGVQAPPGGGQSIAFKPGTSLLYHATHNEDSDLLELRTIDVVTKTITLISADTGVDDAAQALSFDSTGAWLFAYVWGEAYRIDAATGVSTLVGEATYNGGWPMTITGLVAVPPAVADCNENSVPDTCEPDGDGDGTPDACDACPNNAGKADPGACGCEQSDTDSDQDGTPDCVDACPNDAGKAAPGACGCGITDADSDGDGTPDCTDLCPNDASKTAPGACGCGVTDADSDADGTPDCTDLCPNDATKTAPGACGCGVADTPDCGNPPPPPGDADGDGVSDPQDQCPGTPAGTSVDSAGCPLSTPPPDDSGEPIPPVEDGDDGDDAGQSTPEEPNLLYLLCGVGGPQAIGLALVGLTMLRIAPRRRWY